jgi:exopolysaccharide biosynthesis WecB/TagA/CpsF family protein
LRLKLVSSFPDIRIVGCEASVFRPLTDLEDAELTNRINASGAAFVFIGLGCPVQEEFVFNHRKKIQAIQLCVGSAFKFLAEERQVAPQWVQSFALEWIHRLAQDPHRLWRRYLYTNSIFLYLLAVSLLRKLFQKFN